jgi:hypothetical protein
VEDPPLRQTSSSVCFQAALQPVSFLITASGVKIQHGHHRDVDDRFPQVGTRQGRFKVEEDARLQRLLPRVQAE